MILLTFESKLSVTRKAAIQDVHSSALPGYA